MTIRVLIIARRPITLDDFGFESDDEIEVVHFARRLQSLEELADQADVAVIDVDFPEGATYRQMASTTAELPELRVLALTTSPPRHDEVARAIEAGAVGFVEVDADPDEFNTAVRAVHAGGNWLPGPATAAVLRDVATDLEVTTSERRSRLVAVALGLVPVAGALASILSLLWRRYLGHLGVRPVDIGIDPTSRVVDALAAISYLIAAFGPFLYIRGWLDTVESAVSDRTSRRIEDHRIFVGAIFGVVWFLLAAVLSVWADLVLVLVVGPIVGISLLAFSLDLTSEMPSMLRIDFTQPRRAAFTAMAIVFLFIAALSTEVLLRGPEFNEKGAESGFVTAFMGFKAQPVIVTDVDGALPVRQRLYLGGNADLYVLLDPCDGDKIEMVSVGSSRIEVVEDISC